MNETKIEFLLKKILYVSARSYADFKVFSERLDNEYEELIKVEEEPEDILPGYENIREEIEVAPMSDEEKNKRSEKKLFKHIKKHEFTNITLAKCVLQQIVSDNADCERFFEYLVKQKFGRVERNYLKNGSMSTKFVFNKETHDKLMKEKEEE